MKTIKAFLMDENETMREWGMGKNRKCTLVKIKQNGGIVFLIGGYEWVDVEDNSLVAAIPDLKPAGVYVQSTNTWFDPPFFTQYKSDVEKIIGGVHLSNAAVYEEFRASLKQCLLDKAKMLPFPSTIIAPDVAYYVNNQGLKEPYPTNEDVGMYRPENDITVDEIARFYAGKESRSELMTEKLNSINQDALTRIRQDLANVKATAALYDKLDATPGPHRAIKQIHEVACDAMTTKKKSLRVFLTVNGTSAPISVESRELLSDKGKYSIWGAKAEHARIPFKDELKDNFHRFFDFTWDQIDKIMYGKQTLYVKDPANDTQIDLESFI